MSETKTAGNTSEAKVTNNETKEEEAKFSIKVQPIEFEHVDVATFISAEDFGRLAHQIFKEAYDDCYGATFDPMPGNDNRFAISLYFDHQDRPNSSKLAISKDADDDNTKNATLRNARLYQRRLMEGDRYHLTNIGKLGISDFLMDYAPIYKNKSYNKSEFDWSKIVAEVAESSTGYGFPKQLTRVSFIDPAKIAEAVWGKDDDSTVYEITVANSIPSYGGYRSSADRLIRIDKLNGENLSKILTKSGIAVGYQPGINIIRA